MPPSSTTHFLSQNIFNIANVVFFIGALIAFGVARYPESLPLGGSQQWCQCEDTNVYTLKAAPFYYICALRVKPSTTKLKPVSFSLDITDMLSDQRYRVLPDGGNFEIPTDQFYPESSGKCSVGEVDSYDVDNPSLSHRIGGTNAITIPWWSTISNCHSRSTFGNVTDFVIYNATAYDPTSPWNIAVRWTTPRYKIGILVLDLVLHQISE
jgi:hypothetical protein